MFWLVSVPGEPHKDEAWKEVQRKTTHENHLSVNFKFDLPKDLRVGTLDSLLRLSDDLVRADSHMEATTNKIYRQLIEFNPGEKPTVFGVAVETCVKNFTWDTAKFPVKTPLPELVGEMQEKAAQWEDQLKMKLSDYQGVKSQLATIKRKATGSLLVRSLNDIVKPEHFTETEWLTTLLVVFPKYQEKEFLKVYEGLGNEELPAVVPRSGVKHFEDHEHALYSVVVLKKTADKFKNAARDSKFIVRDYQYSADSFAGDQAERGELQSQLEVREAALLKWSKLTFSEAVLTWIHLKAVRVFVESVLRYGVPPNFQAIVMKPLKKSQDKLRKVLSQMYSHLQGAAYAGGAGDDAVMPGGQADFYPFVFLPMNLAILGEEE
eukprot:Rmarinus@m.898